MIHAPRKAEASMGTQTTETPTTGRTTEPTTQQQHPEMARPQKEHRWLEKLVGTWSATSTLSAEPGAAPKTYRGTEKVRSLGGLWIVAETQSEMPGGTTGEMVMTLGYDPDQGHYMGTWVGSMMNWLCVYEKGEVDASGRKLSLYSKGPSMTGEGGTRNYRDVIECIDDDTRTLIGQVQNERGEWEDMMKVDYRRER